eukprot:g20494.t1
MSEISLKMKDIEKKAGDESARPISKIEMATFIVPGVVSAFSFGYLAGRTVSSYKLHKRLRLQTGLNTNRVYVAVVPEHLFEAETLARELEQAVSRERVVTKSWSFSNACKICTKRIKAREQQMHRERVRNMKSTVDTGMPTVATLEHVKIDRDNRILLKKMTEIMKQQTTFPPSERKPGPSSLNKDARRKELLRITRENQSILKRIQQAQPVYNHEEGAMTSRSAPSTSRAPPKDLAEGANQKYVLKEGMKLSDTYYLVDMSTDGRNLFVSAYDNSSSTTLELVIKDPGSPEKLHRQLYRETNGDYRRIADRLKVTEEGKLLLDGEEANGRRFSFGTLSEPSIPSNVQRSKRFQEILEKQLATGAPLPSYTAIRFLSKTWPGCSFGKATAFLVLAVPGVVGRNVTVFEQMMSEWPFWGVLRRVEANERVKLPSEQLRTPPQYMSPVLRPAAGLHQPGGFQHPSPDTELSDGNIQAISRACEARDVHVALSGDGRHMEGLLAAMQSLILGLGEKITGLLAAFRCSFEGRLDQEPPGALVSRNQHTMPKTPVMTQCSGQKEEDAGGEYDFRIDGVGVQIHIFTESEVLTDDLVVDAGVTLETGDLNAPHNFVRFYLAKIVYLDTDVIVKGDVCELHDMAFQSSREAVLAAVPRRHLPLSFYLKVFSPKMPIWLPSTAPSFNAGVMVIDMKLWASGRPLFKWARQNKDRDLWRHGSQPPLLLLLYDRTEWIPDVWNVDGLGHGAPRSPELIRDAKILHWTGPLKPWLGTTGIPSF